MSEFDRLSDRFDNLEKKVEQSGDNVLDFMIRVKIKIWHKRFL